MIILATKYSLMRKTFIYAMCCWYFFFILVLLRQCVACAASTGGGCTRARLFSPLNSKYHVIKLINHNWVESVFYAILWNSLCVVSLIVKILMWIDVPFGKCWKQPFYSINAVEPQMKAIRTVCVFTNMILLCLSYAD